MPLIAPFMPVVVDGCGAGRLMRDAGGITETRHHMTASLSDHEMRVRAQAAPQKWSVRIRQRGFGAVPKEADLLACLPTGKAFGNKVRLPVGEPKSVAAALACGFHEKFFWLRRDVQLMNEAPSCTREN